MIKIDIEKEIERLQKALEAQVRVNDELLEFLIMEAAEQDWLNTVPLALKRARGHSDKVIGHTYKIGEEYED